MQNADELENSKVDDQNSGQKERLDQNFSPDMSSEQLDKNRRSGRGKTINTRSQQNQEADEIAAIDDKNQRRVRRVSAKIKNNESSDLEVSGIKQNQDG